MKPTPRSRRDRIRTQLADLKMPGALEALDRVLAQGSFAQPSLRFFVPSPEAHDSVVTPVHKGGSVPTLATFNVNQEPEPGYRMVDGADLAR